MIYRSLFFVFVFLSALGLKGQDTIVKKNGTVIPAKVLEVGTNAVSYKKSSYLDGPIITINKSEIIYIKYKDGQVEEFLDIPKDDISKSLLDTNRLKNSLDKQDIAANSNLTQQSKNKIELIDGRFTVNSQKASRKDVNRLLEKSQNPAITLPLKVTKTTAMFQKIIKITSIPTTIGGGGAFFWTGINMYNDIRRGRDNRSTYVGAFSSLLTTITFPITSKILKNKSNKMYNKLIDLYNVTN